MMSDDTGKYHRTEQLLLIQPHLDKVAAYDPEKDGENFIDFVLSHLQTCLALRSERERTPDFIRQTSKYVALSEIVIASRFFEVIATRVSKEHWDMDIINDLHKKVREIGTKRGWDLMSLQAAVFLSMGCLFPTTTPKLPKVLDNQDYN